MYRQQYNLPPINPAAFGGLPQQGPRSGPPMSPPNNVGGPQAQPPMDMNKYLINKVMEIKRHSLINRRSRGRGRSHNHNL